MTSLALLVGLSLTAAPEPRCVTAYGQVACGYACVTAYGQVRCALTPLGVCTSAYGQVACFDPPRWVERVFDGAPPKPSCTSAYGRIACGYGCVAAYGKVRCAETPWGVCDDGYGQVACFDPPRWVVRRHHGRDER